MKEDHAAIACGVVQRVPINGRAVTAMHRKKLGKSQSPGVCGSLLVADAQPQSTSSSSSSASTLLAAPRLRKMRLAKTALANAWTPYASSLNQVGGGRRERRV
jgi:hypothetical protein